MSSSGVPQVMITQRPVSLTSQLLRPAQTPTQALNIETLQMLKERMMGTATTAVPHAASASASASSVAAAAPASSSASSSSSLTWISLQRTLPPTSHTASSPEVVNLKRTFASFMEAVTTLVDDERSGAALADTAGMIYRAAWQLQEKEDAATAASQAANQTSSSGADAYNASAAPSAALLTQLKNINAAVKLEVQQRIGRFSEVHWKHCVTLAREMRRQATDMHEKYNKAKLLRELNRMPNSTADASNDSSNGLFMPAPRSDGVPSEALLEHEFGSDLPLLMADEDEPVPVIAAEADSDADDMGLEMSEMATRPLRDVLEDLRQRMRSMGLVAAASSTPVQPAAIPGTGSVLGLTPQHVSQRNPDFLDGDSSEEEDVYAGESDEDENERVEQQLRAIQQQPVRVVHDVKPSPHTVASLPAGELPSNPAQWWSFLVQQCESLVTYNDAGIPAVSGLEIAQQLLGILQSSKADVQNDLLDLLGYDCMDLMGLLLSCRKEIRQITSQHQALARQSKSDREAVEKSQTRRAPDGSVVRGLVGISIQSSSDIEANKNRKRADRRMARRSAREPDVAASKEFIDEARLDAQATMLKGMINANVNQNVSQLPQGSTRTHHKGYEEVYIPPVIPPEIDESTLRLVSKSFDPFEAQAFPRMKTLNRIQSKVYEAAYHHNNNLLICAPTGAGKTNIAMMCVLREIGQHIVDGVLRKDMFKMVYVAPMKALAQEVQSTFQKRLAPLGIQVKELTGDMQLTKKELAETQLIVTTPEKWDVVTRKNADASGGSGLMSLVKLLIIDECHLLNEDRGPVLEILVARTLRLVESSQQMCRIVGLSATLPNYQDVAAFLRAPVHGGLFHFDASYRPVPLSQTFLGVTEKNRMLALQSMNDVTYKKVLLSVQQGHQVMIFVHSRRDTVKTARFLRDQAQKDQNLALFDMTSDVKYGEYERKVARSRNSDMSELFQYGFSCHHAGMVRSDRSLIESAFSAGLIKVLCCTATLAWGVNLPAHTVILKGTQIYNAEKGGFMDVGMLDIQQIFGRAGRPQFDDSGEAVLICEHEKLNKYLNLLTHALPIESQFIAELPNHLNAEIILGTVSTLAEAVEWLSYTYLYTRILRNPIAYGIKFDDMQYDELLVQHRTHLIIEASKLLMRCRMIKFDQRSGQFYSTDVGRVASHYYLHFESIELYNTLLTPNMSDEDILHLLASSKEFSAIKVRDEELLELEKLSKKYVPLEIKGGSAGPTGKQNLLLQVYISNGLIETPTLISDSYFIQQSAGRICRALFEMVLKRGKAFLAGSFLRFSLMIEKKIWGFQSPLRQFLSAPQPQGGSREHSFEGRGGLLKMPTIMRLEERGLKLDQLVDMDSSEISAILRHETMGSTVKQALSYIPWLNISAKVSPITRSVLRIDMEIQAEFSWNDKWHGLAESFWIWIEDTNNEHIYHSELFLLHKKALGDVHKLSVTIPIFEPLPPQYYILCKSDRWLGSDQTITLDFKHLILPSLEPSHTALLDLHPLPRSALRNPAYEKMYEKKFTHFNPIQTQLFHSLYHTDENILLGAPTGSGKTIVSELAMLRLFSTQPGGKVVYIAPLKALARERIEEWSSASSFHGLLDKKIVELTGDTAPDARAIEASDIIITTPEKWDGVSRQWSTRAFVRRVGLVIIDEIHLLGLDRGPVLEVIVSRMRYISSHTSAPIRIVGLSTALSNARDLADWLGIERAGLFNFPTSVRPVPLTIHIQGFAGKNYCPRMASMNKPTYAAIQTHSPNKPVLVFVSSRRQTRLTGLDLIALSAADGNPRKYLHMNEETLQKALNLVSDPNLKNMLSFGIGMHHAGLSARDRSVVEKLFLEYKIQVLVCTSTLAWGVNFPCHLVIVKGTEFYDAPSARYVDMPITDVMQMIGRAGRPQFDKEATAVVLVHEPKKNFYLNFLHSPFPVESSLLSQLHEHVNAEICSSGTIKSIGDFLDYISWTFLFRRLLLNPSYYGMEGVDKETVNEFLLKLVRGILGDLVGAGLIAQDEKTGVLSPLPMGRIASNYYLKYRTMIVFSSRLTPESSVETLLETLAQAKEFEEIPVRHNEEKLNAEMESGMRWSVDRNHFESPHTKTHMLLQAHLSRMDLPISDYYTDLKSILDQSIRVLQAMIDVSAEAGWVSTSVQGMKLMQMVVQGRWGDDSPFLNLPGVQNNARLLSALNHEFGGNGNGGMMKLLSAEKNKVGQLLRKANASEKEVTEFLEMLTRLPQLSMQLSAGPQGGAAASVASASAHAAAPDSSAAPLTPLNPNSAPLQAAPGSILSLSVSLHRRNANSNTRIFTPVFSKPKDEAWWIVVGLSANPAASQGPPSPQDELVAIRRVNTLKTRSTVQLRVPLPPSGGTHHYTVYLVSDSYLGFDQQQSFRVNTGAGSGSSASGPPGFAQRRGPSPRNAQAATLVDVAATAAAAKADPDDIYH